VNADQEPLNFGAPRRRRRHQGIHQRRSGQCRPSWFRCTAWSALLQRVQRRMDGGPHSALLRMPLDLRHREFVRRASLDLRVLRDLP